MKYLMLKGQKDDPTRKNVPTRVINAWCFSRYNFFDQMLFC